MSTRNRVVRLARRPEGLARREDFSIEDAEVAEPGPGEVRVRVDYVSMDPAMRGWIVDAPSYVPPVAIGEVMRAGAAGIVEASNDPKVPVGAAVTGMLGVQRYAVVGGGALHVVDAGLAPLPRWLGGLGMPGLTAYFGLFDVGQPKKGETVLVSGAAGAVGGVVGQLAKSEGCRVVGIAGGPKKVAYVTEELGFDACVDYKAGNLKGGLKDACPDGVDVYFDNVGGETLDTVLTRMNNFGRIAICGAISTYNATEPPPGPKNIRAVLVRRLTMRGFIVFDFAKRYGEAVRELATRQATGGLKLREDVRPGGPDTFPDVLNELFSGGNFGKLVLSMGDDP